MLSHGNDEPRYGCGFFSADAMNCAINGLSLRGILGQQVEDCRKALFSVLKEYLGPVYRRSDSPRRGPMNDSYNRYYMREQSTVPPSIRQFCRGEELGFVISPVDA